MKETMKEGLTLIKFLLALPFYAIAQLFVWIGNLIIGEKITLE
jgi:hypothetical protein